MSALKYTYIRGRGCEWRVILPKMTSAQAEQMDRNTNYDLRRLAWTAESGRKRRSRK